MLTALEDLLRCNCVGETGEARSLLIRERRILRERKRCNFARMSRRKLLRQSCIVCTKHLGSELSLESQSSAACRRERRRQRLTHHIAVVREAHTCRKFRRVLPTI